MLSSPPPSSKDVFFFSLSPRLPGRGTLPFVSKGTLSLSFPLLFFLSLIHGAQRVRERARRSLSPGQGGPREGLGYKRAEKTEEGRKRKDKITRQKREMRLCFCVPMFCALFRSLWFSRENDRRMSGWRERLFSLRPCHGKHIHALWDLFIPWYTAYTHMHMCTYTLYVRSLSSHTNTHTHTPCHETDGRGVKGQALQ